MKNFILDFYNPDIKVFLLFIIVMAVLYFSFWATRRKKGALAIFLLRSSVLLLALFVFLKPVVKWEKARQNKPTVEFWVDNSQSILQNQTIDQRELINQIEAAQRNFKQNNIQTELIAFDSENRSIDAPGELNFDGKATNFSQLMTEKEIDAAVLVSDGQVNAGQDLYKMDWRSDYPVYTIGIGDTSKEFDAKINNLTLPPKIKENEKFEIAAEVTLPKEAGPTNIQLLKNNEVVQSRIVNPVDDAFMQNVDFQLTADKAGEHEFTVLLENDGDKNSHNNSQTSLLKVLPGDKDILILCGAPSFETRSLMTIFRKNDDFNATVVYFRNGNFYPEEQALQENYDLVIISQYPNKSITMQELQQVQTLFNDKALPVIIYINRHTDLNRLNNLVQKQLAGNYSTKTATTTVEANQQNSGHPVLRDVQANLAWMQLPPIQYDFSKIDLHSSFKPLLVASELKEQPVVAISDDLSAVLFIGIDFWRWQMMTDSPNYSQLLLNTTSYLTSNTDNSNIQISPQKKIFMVGETVNLSGLVYDLQGETVPKATVSIALKKDSTLVDEFFLDWDQDNFKGAYLLKTPGEFTMEIKASSGGHLIGKDTTTIKVMERVLEFTETGQNRPLLKYIARESGGELITFEQIKRIPGTLNREHPIKYEKREVNFYSNKLIFGLLLGLLVIEWIIRKYFGHL